MADALAKANNAMDAKKMLEVMVEFVRQNKMAKVKEELLNNMLVDAFNKSNFEEEADVVTGQLLAELGMELDEKMEALHAPSNVPLNKEWVATEEEQALMDAVPDLRAQLNTL